MKRLALYLVIALSVTGVAYALWGYDAAVTIGLATLFFCVVVGGNLGHLKRQTDEYNGGICRHCGFTYRYQGAVGDVGEYPDFRYKCSGCGHTIYSMRQF